MTDRGAPGDAIFDAHFHIVDTRFPLVSNQGYLPPAYTCDDYLRAARPLGIAGGAVVSGSFQAFDQSYLVDALARLGEGFVGVTQLPATVPDEEVLRLHVAGVRALRFNVKRGGSAGLEDVPSLARRVQELAGWHVEFYIDSAELDALHPMLRTLPRFSIDHLGLSRRGFATLLKLAEQGARVKATGFGRLDFDVAQGLRDLAAANPDCLMFGTDLPSTRAPRPFDARDIDLIRDTLDEATARKVFWGNGRDFYFTRSG
jgi:predicted TIM-barrel fold metal-dependent hydrolase